jgi:hypothetical protein
MTGRATCDGWSRWPGLRREKRRIIKVLSPTHRDRIDNDSATTTYNPKLAHQGRQPVAYRLMERAAVPACGFADCTRAASDPARPVLRPVREELATGERPVRSLSQKTQPEAEPEVTAWRVPRRSAERRARPQADDRGNATHSWRAPYRPRIRMRSSEVPVRRLTTRLSALRPPYSIWGGFRAVAWQSSGANENASRE